MLKKEVSVGGYAQKEVSVGRYTQVQPTVPQLSVKSSCINTTKKNMYLGGGEACHLLSIPHPSLLAMPHGAAAMWSHVGAGWPEGRKRANVYLCTCGRGCGWVWQMDQYCTCTKCRLAPLIPPTM